ncbi:hypothetical protein DL93DRAFT_1970850 [Clavulina sp. PMI_390]|nr:hypothetical protein DL93DRAFT_1970850 [Clavulina sp. PMI_390]
MVKTFPSELIIDVLLFVCEGVDYDYGLDHPEALQSRLRVSQVCSYWRELVIATSRFWTNITWFTQVYRRIDNWGTNVITEQISGLLYTLDLFFERSLDAPIDLWVCITGVFPRKLPMWDIIDPHLHRCRSLKIMSSTWIRSWDHIFPLRGHFPYLTHLRIERIVVDRIFQLEDAAPHLFHLSLDQCDIFDMEELKIQSQRTLCLAFTREKERQEYGSSPYWDKVDRALLDRRPGRTSKSRLESDPLLPSSSDALVLRLRHTEPRIWIDLLPHLQHVIIAKTKITWTLLEELGDLPHLKTLTFAQYATIWLRSTSDNKFPVLEHLIFHQCEDLDELKNRNWATTSFPALRRFTSRFTLRWKGQWKEMWTRVLPEGLRARPDLVFEWFYRTPEGRRRRPFWDVGALGDVADRVVELSADEADEFGWVEPDRRQLC